MNISDKPKWIQELVREFGLDPDKIHIDVSLMPKNPNDNESMKSFFGDIYITVTNQKEQLEKRNAAND